MEVKLFESIEDAFEVLKEDQPRLIRAGKKNICIIRRGNSFVAFDNECPHQGESLHRGVVNYLGEIVCPLHSYRFDLTNGETTSQPCNSLNFIPVIVKEGVWLEI